MRMRYINLHLTLTSELTGRETQLVVLFECLLCDLFTLLAFKRIKKERKKLDTGRNLRFSGMIIQVTDN